ncbi:MAG: hypothetical protein FJ303_00795 [Planctomycetes bacterium]|nr:hypothetical protein [Planctomycetota bacterium]
MNFLLDWLAITPEKNARVTTVHWESQYPAIGWIIAIILFALFAWAMVGLFYAFERGTLGWFSRTFLIGLRWGILLIIVLLLLFQPKLVANFEAEHPVGVLLLIDNSQSMQQRDRRLSNADKARVALALGRLELSDKAIQEEGAIPADLPSDLSRLDLVEKILRHKKLNLIQGLEKKGPLRSYYFGHDIRGLKDDKKDSVENILGGFKAAESRTALADSIIKIAEVGDAEAPVAIVVITDGQDNASKYTLEEAAEKCRLRRIPLHIYGVGSTEGGLLELKEVGGATGTLFAEDQVTVPVRWKAQGLKKGKVEITLSLGGETVGKKEVDVKEGDDLREEFTFLVPKNPDKKETHDLVATIKYKTEAGVHEKTYDGTMTRSVRIDDSKIKILYIENLPRWEFKFLQPALSNRFKKRCEVDFILVNAAPEVAKGGPPYLPAFFETKEAFLAAKYNLIILGDVASTYFNKDQQEWIKTFVENGGGMIVMAGRQNMPASYDEKSPIAEMLPIEYRKEKFGIDQDKATEEYKPTLTDAGQRTDWLFMGETPPESTEVWENKLVGFHWSYPVQKLKPVAQALIVNPRVQVPVDGNTTQPMPILATHLFGKGRVVWLGTDETWRWRWNHQDKYFDRFWGQLIYKLGSPSLSGSGIERTQIALNRSQALVGSESTVYVTLLDKDFNPRKDLKVEAELEYMDAKQGDAKRLVTLIAKLNAKGEPIGQYTLTERHNDAGRFELRIRNPEQHTFSFRVDLPPKHELEQSGLAEKALRDAAKLSGGKFYREDRGAGTPPSHHSISELVSSLESRTVKSIPRPLEVTKVRYVLAMLALFTFLAVITLEWVIRKFSDLS